MANYGTKITLSLPTGGQVSWDGPLNDVLNAIIDVLADRVTPAGFNYSTDLDAQGHALIDVRDIAFAPSADTGAVNTIFVAGSGQAGVTAGEWYLRDSSNNLVQLTSGGTINVASNAGFGGGYAAASQAAGSPIATYNSANGRFSFTTEGSTPAEISAGALTGTQLDVNGGLAQFSGLTTLTGPVQVTGSMALSGTFSAYTTGSVTLGGAAGQVGCPRAVGEPAGLRRGWDLHAGRRCDIDRAPDGRRRRWRRRGPFPSGNMRRGRWVKRSLHGVVHHPRELDRLRLRRCRGRRWDRGIAGRRRGDRRRHEVRDEHQRGRGDDPP